MKFEKAFEAFATFLETLSVAMTAAYSINQVVNFFRCTLNSDPWYQSQISDYVSTLIISFSIHELIQGCKA
jgi:hypothetical protein